MIKNKLRFGQVNLKANHEYDKWVNIVALPLIAKNYSTGNPSIDREGKILILHLTCSSWWNDLWK
jgi:hypothetical protein